jgi:uncharacterized membrane protein
MAYCSNCGSEMTGAFCGKCGAPAAGAPPPQQGYTPPQQGYQQQQQGYQQPYAGAPAAAGMGDNAAGALCYLAGLITGVIFLVIAPYNTKPTVRFHAFQSILFNVAWIAIWIVVGVIIGMMPFGVSVALAGLSSLLSLLFLALWLFLMYRAYQNQPFELPVIGAMARQFANKQ